MLLKDKLKSTAKALMFGTGIVVFASIVSMGLIMALNYNTSKIETTPQDTKDKNLGQFAVNMMVECERFMPEAKKLSKARKITLAQSIVRITNNVFDSDQNKRDMVTAWAIESCFQKFAQSPTGPKGYSQVAKAAFKEGMKACGVPDAKDDDVWETDLNLYAGACYFRTILETKKDSYLSIVAYNQGPNSEAAKKYEQNGRVGNVEALEYIAQFTYLARKVTDNKLPNAPDINENPFQKAN
jgi:hypothetical protein